MEAAKVAAAAGHRVWIFHAAGYYTMRLQAKKYWQDILVPIMRRDRPPTIPQAIVLQNQRVLLVKRDNPLLWELPGGGMRTGESLEEALVREVQEETGIRIEVTELLGWYERTGFRAHRSPVYVCRPHGGTLRPQTDEAVRVAYSPLHALPHGLFPWLRPILQQDLLSTETRPLQRRQHLGVGTVLHCLVLDIAGRLCLLD